MYHHATLTYSNNDDGVWLQCTCGHEENLGYDAPLLEAVEKHNKHVKQYEES